MATAPVRYDRLTDDRQHREFYQTPTIRELSGLKRWTVSTKYKMPVDVVALQTNTKGLTCPRCGIRGCNTVHGAQPAHVDEQLMTLDALGRFLPDATNVALHLDARTTGYLLLDIEADCPEPIADQLLRLATGNAAGGPRSLYSEISSSGKGYHLLMPLPDNIDDFPSAIHRVKIQHPKRWFEVLVHHWTTFTRVPIPPERLAKASAEPLGDHLTWEGLFADLVALAPGGSYTAASGGVDDAVAATVRDTELTETMHRAADEAEAAHRQGYAKDLGADFDFDRSRWEFSVLTDLAYRAHRALADTQLIAWVLDPVGPVPAPDAASVLTVLYELAGRVLPARSKHDGTRRGLPYLLYRSAEAMNVLDLGDELNSPDPD